MRLPAALGVHERAEARAFEMNTSIHKIVRGGDNGAGFLVASVVAPISNTTGRGCTRWPPRVENTAGAELRCWIASAPLSYPIRGDAVGEGGSAP